MPSCYLWGGMIGSAIFALSSTTGMLAGPSSALAWAMAGVLMLLIALNFAELGTAFPYAGGVYVYPMETYGHNRTVRIFGSFLAGWTCLIGQGIGVAFSAMFLGSYLNPLIPGATDYAILIGAVILTFAFVINALGIYLTGKTNLVLTLILIVTLLAFSIRGIPAITLANFKPFFASGSWGFLQAIPVASCGFGAWMAIVAAAEEVRNPSRDIPRALIYSLILAIVICVLVQVAIFGTTKWTNFTPTNEFAYFAPLSFAAAQFAPGSKWMETMISVGGTVALVTTIIALMVICSRVLMAMGRDGLFPSVFGYINPKTKAPLVSLGIVYGISMIVNCFPQYIFKIIIIGAVCRSTSFALGLLSEIFLRVFRKDVKPPFRLPGGLTIPIISLAALAILTINVGLLEVEASLTAIAIGIAYFFCRYASKTGIFSERSTILRDNG